MKSKGGSGGHADEDNDQMPYSQYVKKPGFAYYRDLAGWLALADNVCHLSVSHGQCYGDGGHQITCHV